MRTKVKRPLAPAREAIHRAEPDGQVSFVRMIVGGLRMLVRQFAM